MLETAHERVKLLKAGITGKTIERLYIVENNFKMVRSPNFFDLIEINPGESKEVINQGSVAKLSLSSRIGVGLSCPAFA